MRNRFLSTVLALVAVAVTTTLAPSLYRWLAATHHENPTAPLVDAVRGARLLEPRVSGGFGWEPWSRGPEGSPESARDAAIKRVISAAAAVQRTGASTPVDAPIEHVMGVARLLVGETLPAISALEPLLANETTTSRAAALMNDLAAAYLVRGSASDDIEHVLQALELAERASRLDPALVEARFNKALASERFGASSLALAAWDEYLLADLNSPWAREAQQRRADLAERRARSRKVDTRRRTVEETLLLGWAAAVADGGSGADLLESVRTAADAAPPVPDDAYVDDLIREAEQSQRTGRASVFAQAYQEGHQARRLLVENNQIGTAREFLDRARRRMGPAGALAHYLTYWSLLVEWYQGHPDALERPLLDLIGRAQRASHPFIAARAQILLGSVYQRLSRYSEAIESYERGITTLAALQETGAAASARMLLAGALRASGLWRDAWRNERAALAELDALHEPAQRHNVLREAVRLALAQRQVEVAAFFARALERDAHAWGDGGALFSVGVYRAQIELNRGNPAGAAAALAEAQRRFEVIEDATFRESYRLDLMTLQAQVRVASEPELAVSAARALVERAVTSGALFRRVQAYWLLGRAEQAAGRIENAIAAWQTGVGELERDDRSIREERMRIARTSEIWDIFDDLMRMLVRQGRDAEAVQVAERGRSRVLREALQRTLDARDLAMRPGTADLPGAILYYAALPEETLVWVLRHGRLTARRSAAGSRAIGRYLRALDAAAEGAADPGTALAGLHRLLVAPIADQIAAGEPLTIIPDALLARVPFAALRAGAHAAYLIEDHEITMSPSLELLRAATARLRRVPSVFATGVAAGDGRSPGLPSLPGARREVEGVATLYGTLPLRGESLSKGGLFARARSADVVHFAGHAVADAEYPSRSYLALHGSGPAARLHPGEITPESFGRVQLVVLSGCSTADGQAVRGEGVLSLARPFLASGVPFVVATLRPVDDGVDDLLVEFHRRLREGQAPTAALREAQLRALRQDRATDLRGWAAFTIYGGLPSRR